jgi:GNAT superfamily N-acetyltransferase
MDMLVKLYDLPDTRQLIESLGRERIDVRRVLAADKHTVILWVRKSFSERWASETEVAFSRQPVSCFVAVQDATIMGFACHDATCRNFFGPTGVISEARNKGIGRALLLACLEDMRNRGFGYAIIGGVGPADYYAKAVGAVPIEGSEPGIYRGLLGPWHFDRDPR